jgi:acyl transferase domain-containing protein/surfactin synthase thioesterase subunit
MESKNNFRSLEKWKNEIAIVGMACRFPGANDYNQFWQNLEQGVNSVTEIPGQRWQLSNFYSPLLQQPNKSISKWGGFVQEVDQFDASFFGISPREAIRIDPQQRLMLELSWLCLEDAGYSPLELSGSPIGVFIGACSYDSILTLNEEEIDVHSGTGSWTTMIPNRISAYFNFSGPSLPVDTACSSSLVAIHQAINALKEQECDQALVGGISVLLSPTTYIQMSQQNMLSPRGKCRTFDSGADGYVRGEGAGVILLKPLEKAIQDKDHIHGVIKGSAVNHGGKARTLTSPNIYAQAKVIRAAHQKADIAPNTISYIETHGTGTPLGDPIEINGLKRAFRQKEAQGEHELTQSKHSYCGLGTVKTNLGHLEGAAGIAGVIKVLLAMKHRKLPKLLNFEQLNPHIKLEGSPFYIVLENQNWEQIKTQKGETIPRRSGVSAFGIGGTNAHIVLEEAPSQLQNQNVIKNEDYIERSLEILTLSAKTETALQELVTNYYKYLQSDKQTELGDICYTANTGRAHFNHRLAFIAANKQELAEKLHQYQSKEQVPGITSGKISSSSSPRKIAFLFTGQGSQYVNMGRQLYQTQAVFRAAIDQCEQILGSQLEYPLLEILYPSTTEAESLSRLNQTAYTQVALFAVEYALAQLWQSWGIKPDVVVGHSVGEYVAATIARIISLEDGLKLIAARGSLMQKLSNDGEMVAVMASAQQVESLLSEYSHTVSLAAINAPKNVVISGEKTAVAAICQQLSSVGIKTKRLQVSHAFHSPLMTPMLAEFEVIANQITYHQPQIPVISNLTGEIADERITTAQYWLDHVLQPVMFAQSMQTLSSQGYEVFLEVGPQPHLLSMGRQCLPQQVGVWLASMRTGVSEWQQMLSSLAQLYVQGVAVDWSGFERDYHRQKVVLPTYPFQRQRYWIEMSNGRYQDKSITSENDSSLIVNLIKQGEIKALTQQLETVGNLSKSEVALLPKLLKLMVQQHQQQLTKASIGEIPLLQQKSVQKLEILQELQAVSTIKYKQILIEYLQKQIRKILQINVSHSLDTQQSILELGFDSLSVIELKIQLEAQLKVTIPASEIIQGPSIIELAEQLTEQLIQDSSVSNMASSQDEITELANQTASWIAYHKPKPNSYLRLFCFHPWGSSASIFKNWSDELPPHIEVLPIQLPGRQQRLKEKPFTEFVTLIQVLGDFIHPYLDKPFAFYGHSMGALIAFELAYVVKQKYNINPQYLFLGGAQPPSDVSFLNRIENLSQNQTLNYLLDISEIPEAIYNDKSLVEEFMEIFKADLQLLQSYCHKEQEPLDCPIYIFGGVDDASISEKQLSLWYRYTQNTFKLQMLPGKHMFLNTSRKLILDIIYQEILKLNSNE